MSVRRSSALRTRRRSKSAWSCSITGSDTTSWSRVTLAASRSTRLRDACSDRTRSTARRWAIVAIHEVTDAAGAVEARREPPDLDEHLLHHLLGVRVVADDTEDDAVHQAGRRVVQVGEGRLVAATGADDQRSERVARQVGRVVTAGARLQASQDSHDRSHTRCSRIPAVGGGIRRPGDDDMYPHTGRSTPNTTTDCPISRSVGATAPIGRRYPPRRRANPRTAPVRTVGMAEITIPPTDAPHDGGDDTDVGTPARRAATALARTLRAVRRGRRARGRVRRARDGRAGGRHQQRPAVTGARRRRPRGRRRAATCEGPRDRLVRHQGQGRAPRRHRHAARDLRARRRHGRRRPALEARDRRRRGVRRDRRLRIADHPPRHRVVRRAAEPGRRRRRRAGAGVAAPPADPAGARTRHRHRSRHRTRHRARLEPAGPHRPAPIRDRVGRDRRRCRGRRCHRPAARGALRPRLAARVAHPAGRRPPAPDRSRRGAGRGRRRLTVLHAERRLLPHRHRPHRAAGLGRGLGARDRRHGRATVHDLLRRSARPRDRRVRHHAHVRVERDRRFAARHRPLARRAPRRPARRGRHRP